MKTKKKFAVILAGCGNRDGAEIHESVMTLYAIARTDSSYTVFAPDVNQYHVINHYTGQPTDETRNVLVESARIARGKIRPLSEFNAQNFDILMFAGGFGVAKNLCTYAFDGIDCTVNPEVERAVISMHSSRKPIGALCISPVILAKVLGNVSITMGQDQTSIKNIKAMGAIHQTTHAREIVIDNENKVVTSPCYMLDSSIVDIAEGAMNTVNALIELT
ncbi:MAG: isoprenoid biosynthesis protein ElbB [Porphyromonadaceae bacterium]|nr:MAG: isoprenoid biosynthesis protein ElbB [Porphyromonadaceae bacterium]